MGISILEMVLRSLEEAGFAVAEAYPGRKFPQITEPVAAYHIQKVDGANQTVTMEINILCPESMGGSACEQAALKATEALQTSRAVCVQSGCVYDGVAQVYSVSILAVYSGVAENNDCVLGPDFQVHISGVYHPWVVAFSEEKVQEQTMEFTAGSPEGYAITSGSYHWNIRLEEVIPTGFQETVETEEEFQLRLVRGTKTQIFSPCRWSSVTRTFTAEGIRRVCKGIALVRKEDEA